MLLSSTREGQHKSRGEASGSSAFYFGICSEKPAYSNFMGIWIPLLPFNLRKARCRARTNSVISTGGGTHCIKASRFMFCDSLVEIKIISAKPLWGVQQKAVVLSCCHGIAHSKFSVVKNSQFSLHKQAVHRNSLKRKSFLTSFTHAYTHTFSGHRV